MDLDVIFVLIIMIFYKITNMQIILHLNVFSSFSKFDSFNILWLILKTIRRNQLKEYYAKMFQIFEYSDKLS